jgi:prephenate dehydrogenase
VTRIAASNPELWVAILRANRGAVLEALEALHKGLGRATDAIATGSWADIQKWLAEARTARLELFAKPEYGREPVALSMLVPDRPGVLAEVTTQAGGLGVNIEDLRIVHSTEGGRGRLELIIGGEAAAGLLTEALEQRGYRVERIELG